MVLRPRKGVGTPESPKLTEAYRELDLAMSHLVSTYAFRSRTDMSPDAVAERVRNAELRVERAREAFARIEKELEAAGQADHGEHQEEGHVRETVGKDWADKLPRLAHRPSEEDA